MKKNNPTSVIVLILTAFIWGMAFVAQSEGGDAAGTFTFVCIRSVITSVFLSVLVAVLEKRPAGCGKPADRQQKKDLIVSGILCGICLYFTSVFQQLGMQSGTPVGKAGFLTACYVVLVPVSGIFLGKRCEKKVWAAVAITLAGLWLLCIKGDFSFRGSDFIVLGAAVMCAIQIHVIDAYIDRVNAVRMSQVQFITSAVIGIIPMIIIEAVPAGIEAWGAPLLTRDAILPLLYTGFLSGGLGYTMQMIGQKGCEPAVASLLMSLESVFSVLAGWVLLNQQLSGRELIGCGLIFGAVVLSQLPQKTSVKESV